MRLKSHEPHRVDEESGCWIWLRSISDTGYGNLMRDGRVQNAHRYYYERAKGPVPDGLDLDHLCRNRACVNPDHLEPLTRAENCRRGAGTKLDWAKVAVIRASHLPHTELAQRFGVTPTAIRYVRNGTTWVAA